MKGKKHRLSFFLHKLLEQDQKFKSLAIEIYEGNRPLPKAPEEHWEAKDFFFYEGLSVLKHLIDENLENGLSKDLLAKKILELIQKG